MSRTLSMNSGSVESLKVSVRLQPERPPRAAYRALREPKLAGEPARAPVRRIARQRVERGGDEALDLRIPDAPRCPGARLIEQSFQPPLHKTGAPLAHGLGRYAQPSCHLAIGRGFGAGEHNARAQRQRLSGLAPARPLRQLIVLFHTQPQFRYRSPFGHGRLLVAHSTVRQVGE
jgi:hypothetical protein